MIPIKVSNGSGRAMRQWVDIGVPTDIFEASGARWFKTNDLPEHYAIKGEQIGDVTMMHVLMTMQPHESPRETELVPTKRAPIMGFIPSPWVTDDVPALLPKPLVQTVMNGDVLSDPEPNTESIDLLEDGPARQVWRRRMRIKDTLLVFDAYYYIYSWQEAVRVEFTFTNSDPRTTDLSQSVFNLGIATGEYFELDWRRHFGVKPPHRVNNEWWQMLPVPQSRAVDDAQQLSYTGWLLCVPQDGSVIHPDSGRRINNLLAYIDNGEDRGRGMFGLFTDWAGHYGAYAATPRAAGAYPGLGHKLGFESRLTDHQGAIDALLPWGMLPNAGSTGRQEDFGACKGSGILSGEEPELIERQLYMLREHLRPFHNREADGSPVLFKNHPNWRTWSQRSDTRQGHATDSLGKEMVHGGYAPTIHGTGWGGIDDQHRSMNNFVCALTMTGSYALREILNDFLQCDLAQYENRIDSPRGEGRLFLAWANMLKLLTGEDVVTLRAHMLKRLREAPEAKNVPIDVIGLGSDPALQEPDGSRVRPAWIVWEHGIACMGYYAAWLVTKEDEYLDMTKRLARLVTNHGCYHDGVKWQICTAVRFVGDQPIPLADYRNPIHARTDAGGGWWWFGPIQAVKIASLVFTDSQPTIGNPADEIVERADSILAQVMPAGLPANWLQAEDIAVTQMI